MPCLFGQRAPGTGCPHAKAPPCPGAGQSGEGGRGRAGRAREPKRADCPPFSHHKKVAQTHPLGVATRAARATPGPVTLRARADMLGWEGVWKRRKERRRPPPKDKKERKWSGDARPCRLSKTRSAPLLFLAQHTERRHVSPSSFFLHSPAPALSLRYPPILLRLLPQYPPACHPPHGRPHGRRRLGRARGRQLGRPRRRRCRPKVGQSGGVGGAQGERGRAADGQGGEGEGLGLRRGRAGEREREREAALGGRWPGDARKTLACSLPNAHSTHAPPSARPAPELPVQCPPQPGPWPWTPSARRRRPGRRRPGWRARRSSRSAA